MAKKISFPTCNEDNFIKTWLDNILELFETFWGSVMEFYHRGKDYEILGVMPRISSCSPTFLFLYPNS